MNEHREERFIAKTQSHWQKPERLLGENVLVGVITLQRLWRTPSLIFS